MDFFWRTHKKKGALGEGEGGDEEEEEEEALKKKKKNRSAKHPPKKATPHGASCEIKRGK